MFFCAIGKSFVMGGRINLATSKQAGIEVANHTGSQTAYPHMQVSRSRHALAAVGSFMFAFVGRTHASPMIFEQTGVSKTLNHRI